MKFLNLFWPPTYVGAVLPDVCLTNGQEAISIDYGECQDDQHVVPTPAVRDVGDQIINSTRVAGVADIPEVAKPKVALPVAFEAEAFMPFLPVFSQLLPLLLLPMLTALHMLARVPSPFLRCLVLQKRPWLDMLWRHTVCLKTPSLLPNARPCA